MAAVQFGGPTVAFPDALWFALALKARGVRFAAASSSRNANVFLARIHLDMFAREENQGEPTSAPG